MKMATLATYFGLDQQIHRSLDDVRMNLDVVRNSWVSPNAITRSRTNGNSSAERTGQNTSALSLSVKVENHSASSPPSQRMEENHQTLLLTAHNTGELVEVDPENAGPFNMGVFNDIVGKEPLPEACNRHTDFFEPCDISIRFGISTKFVDHAGRPGLNIVVNALPSLCKILDESDGLAQKLSMDSGSHSEWRPVVSRKAGFFNCPTVQFHLPTVTDGDIVRCTTEIYQKDASSMQRLVFSRLVFSSFNSWDSVGCLPHLGCLRLSTECWHPIDCRKVDCSFRLMD